MPKIRLLILAVFMLLFTTAGCILPEKKHDNWKPIDENKAPVVHEVQWKAETLSIIAKWYTGESKNWQLLADANPNINPDSISIGNQIFIPSDLVKTRDPMPKQFAKKWYQKPKKKEAPLKSTKGNKKGEPGNSDPESAPSNDVDFEVIGPK